MGATQFAVLTITLCYAYMDDPEYLENCTQKVFEFRSCKKWAKDEIIERLCLHPDVPPLQIVEEFEETVAEIANTKFIFEYAREFAQSVVDLLSTT